MCVGVCACVCVCVGCVCGVCVCVRGADFMNLTLLTPTFVRREAPAFH